MGTWYKEIDANGNVVKLEQLPCDCTDIRWALLFCCPFVHSAVMLRRSAVPEAIGFYNENLAYSLDYELWSRVAKRFSVANLDEHLLRLRIHSGSMTSTYGDRT